MAPRMKSSSDAFAASGNPWNTDKEGRRDYGRTLETEDPSVDQYYYAKKAKTKKDKPCKGRQEPSDKAKAQRIAINKRIQLKKLIKEVENKPIIIK